MRSSVYVISSEPGPVKIGISNNVGARLDTIQTASPFPLRLSYAGTAPNGARAIERRVHQILAKHNTCGEWFNVSVADAIDAVLQAAEEFGVELTPLEDSTEGTTAPFSLRLDPELKAALQEAAAAEGRSLSSLVTKILKEWARKRR